MYFQNRGHKLEKPENPHKPTNQLIFPESLAFQIFPEQGRNCRKARKTAKARKTTKARKSTGIQ